MTLSEAKQVAFFESLLMFMATHGFDGVDIDWEYPVADDRGCGAEDFKNYVYMLSRLRARLDGSGRRPASYWYLRGFDVIHLERFVDWFNIMTYDIHGVWDSTDKFIGSYAYAHTNLTEISQGLELHDSSAFILTFLHHFININMMLRYNGFKEN